MATVKQITNRRQTWLNQHHVLRRQKSLNDVAITIQNPSLNLNTNPIVSQANGLIPRSDRSKHPPLQKQFSIDQIPTRVQQRSKCESVTRVSDITAAAATWSVEAATAEYALPSESAAKTAATATASKKRPFIDGHGDDRDDKNFSERIKKTLRGNDDRINLDIFLAQEAIYTDQDSLHSDLESQCDSGEISQKDNLIGETTLTNTPTTSNLIYSQPIQSAANKRAQFQSSRGGEINTSILSTNNCSTASILEAVKSDRRPPLIRAMSAPIRTFDESTKNILANKKKPKRRKLISRSINNNERESIIETNNNNNNNNSASISGDYINTINDKSRSTKGGKKSLSRSRSTIGCDVVTLVSLLSLDGSDSEKEEPNLTPDSATSQRRPPLLRKTGKSVSFQEKDIPSYPSTGREFPQALRRGSVAPLAARIRANRPPTAPPGSVFIQNFDNSQCKMAERLLSGNDEQELRKNENNPSKEKRLEKEESNENKNVQFPDNVRTVKERECWKLYQKMAKKGVSVSYDTILRGMLTPTELRIIQKQKDIENAKRQTNIDNKQKSPT